MVVLLRVVLDQLVSPTDPDVAEASQHLADALAITAPRGCGVEAILPAGDGGAVDGAATTRRLRLGRREMLATWPAGVGLGVAGGMIHSPTLLAPLVRHDRLHDGTQAVVTLWDLDPWEHPDRLSRGSVGWRRAMLRRAVRHADAVVVPSHAIAERLGHIAPLGDRIRVVAGAAPLGFAEPEDAELRRTDLTTPDEYVVLVGEGDALNAGFAAAAAAGLHAIVLDAAEGTEPALVEQAVAAGMPERHAHARLPLNSDDRAALLAGARALITLDPRAAWPWRAIEAMTLGTPVIAIDSDVHHDVLADGATIVTQDEVTDALTDVRGEGEQRARVLASDRSRAFSWLSSAERVWALHADL